MTINSSEYKNQRERSYLFCILSLYLIMLEFFLLLHSMSDPTPARAKQVLEGVHQTFRNELGEDLIPGAFQNHQGIQRFQTNPIIQQLFLLFRRYDPHIKIINDPIHLRWSVIMAQDQLWQKDSNHLDPQLQNTLAEAVKLLQPHPTSLDRLEIVLPAKLSTPEFTQDDQAILTSLRLVDAWVTAGMDRQKIIPTFAEFKPGMVKFSFYYQDKNP